MDISGLLAQHGPGVHSLMVWNRTTDARVISEYSILHEVTPPGR